MTLEELPDQLAEVYLPKAPGKKGSAVRSQWSKEMFIKLVAQGWNYSQSARRLDLTYRWVAVTRKRDPEWWALVRDVEANEMQKWEYPDYSLMKFHEFFQRYTGMEFAEHQHWISDALEDPLGKIVLILGHPESGKSTLVSLWYVLYRLAQDPDSRTAIVTKNGTKAQDLVVRVQRHLTEEHLYDDAPQNLIVDFNGFKPTREQNLEWSQDQFFVKHRKSGERDPSVQGLGIGKLIYGSRLDYLILDDALVQDNQTSPLTRERIDNWFDSEARSRAQRGQTIVNGTRLIPQDLYGVWQKSWKDNKLFRAVIIPAIQNEYQEDERVTWEEYWTLDGYDEIETINGEEHIIGYQMGLRDIRESIVVKNPSRWRLVYQQEPLEEEEAIFTHRHIDAALELGANRKLGQVFDHEQLVLGVDPATTGRAASVLLAIDPVTKVRTVVDLFVGSGLGATGVRYDLMYHFWEKYKEHRVDTTVIESNFVKTLKGDEAFMARAEAHGTHLPDWHTSGRGKQGKWDEEYGIAAMEGLFTQGLMAFANAGPGDERKLAPLIEDLLIFPWSEVQDAAIAIWLSNSQAASVHRELINQAEMKQRRGVPDVVTRRGMR